MQDLKNHDVPMREPSPVPTEKGSPPPPDWWEAIKHRMEEMEESLEQIDAELTLTRQPDVREMVDKLFERRLAAVREVRKQEAEKMARQSPPEIVLPPGCLQTIKENTERWREIEARQLTAIRGISDLITEIGQLKNKLESMEKEATEERQIFAKVDGLACFYFKSKRAANEELCRQKAKLEKDLETFMCRPRLEPPVSAEDSSQKLIKELERTIEEVVQKMWEVEVAPTVKTMGDVVVETSNQRLEDLFRAMWQTLGPTMDMVEGVSRWLDSQELSLTAPRE
ncbi:hypothetical protein ID866_1458 [Astraeus odoratus]|nr:hypothetical protein ID866_1458 [Astraeus odoratus]